MVVVVLKRSSSIESSSDSMKEINSSSGTFSS